MINRRILLITGILAALVVLSACGGPGGGEEPAEEAPPEPAEAAEPPTEVPTAVPPPTETPEPTPEPLPSIVVNDGETAADGCIPVDLNTDSWGSIYTGYTGGGDPFFQLHDTEDGFYFNAEFYTVYGGGWTGQLGTFAPDCGNNGICVYLVPDDENPYLATAGEVTITALAEDGGSLSGPVDVTFTNLTLQPVPGSASQGCYHIDEVQLTTE